MDVELDRPNIQKGSNSLRSWDRVSPRRRPPSALSLRPSSQLELQSQGDGASPGPRTAAFDLRTALAEQAEKHLPLIRLGAELVSAALISLIFLLVLKGLLLTLIGEGL